MEQVRIDIYNKLNLYTNTLEDKRIKDNESYYRIYRILWRDLDFNISNEFTGVEIQTKRQIKKSDN